MPFGLPSSVSSSVTWSASSRVGASTSAAGAGSPAETSSTIGRAKASVFPDPVGALPRMSRPWSASGTTRDWIRNGSTMPRAASACSTTALTPSAPNDWDIRVRLSFDSGSRCRPETIERGEREAGSHGLAGCRPTNRLAAALPGAVSRVSPGGNSGYFPCHMPGLRVASVALLAIMGALALGGGTATATPGTVAYVVMYSDTGDYIGAGTQREFDPGNASITVYGSAGDLTISLDGGTSGDYWDIEVAAAPGHVLTSGGIYTDAQRAPFRQAGHPGIDIYGSGRGCNTDTGLFEVKDIATDSSGAISRLWIVYQQHCEGGHAATWGEVKLNEPVDVGATVAAPGIVRWPTTDVGAPNTGVPGTVV